MLYIGLYGRFVKSPIVYCALHRCYIDRQGLKLKKKRCLICRHKMELEEVRLGEPERNVRGAETGGSRKRKKTSVRRN